MTLMNTIVNPQKGSIKAIVPVNFTTTVDAYAEVIELDTRWLEDTNIIIGVVGNDLDYRVTVFNDYALGAGYETTSGTVAVADSDQIILKRHARVTVDVKPTVGGLNGTANISVIAGR